MNKVIFIFFVLAGVVDSFGQELDGVWMSYNNRIINSKSVYTRGDEGILIDFDNLSMGHIKSDTLINVMANFKNKKVKLRVEGIKGKGKLNKFGLDSLEMNSGQNTVHVFRKLDLSHKINWAKKEITDFLIKHKFDSIQGIKGEFSKGQFFRDITFDRPHTKNQFVNKNWNDYGYWFIKKINGNAFLVFTIGQTEPNNILQILSVDKNGLRLRPLQDDEWMKNLTEIKTCL